MGSRLVYYRVQSRPGTVRARRDARAMTNKLAIKDQSSFYDWLQRELDRIDFMGWSIPWPGAGTFCRSTTRSRRELYLYVCAQSEPVSRDQAAEDDDLALEFCPVGKEALEASSADQ